MGWFNNQIEERRQRERETLSDSFEEIARTVMGYHVGSRSWREDANVEDALIRLLHYYRIREKDIPPNLTGLEDKLDYLLSSSGVHYREVRLKPGWHRDSLCPLVTTLTEGALVVTLLPEPWGGYAYIDPRSGKKLRVTAAEEKRMAPDALAFYRPLPQRKLSSRDIFRYMAACLTIWDLVSFGVSALLIALVGLLLPRLNRILMGPVVDNESFSLLSVVMTFLLFVTLGNLMFTTIRDLLLARIGTKINTGVQAAAMMRALSLPASFFKRYAAGELSQYLAYLDSLCDILINSVFSGTLTGVFSLVYFTQIFSFAKGLVLPSLLVTFLTVGVSLIASLSQFKRTEARMEVTAKEKGFVFTLISGIQKIRLAGAECRSFSHWAKFYAKKSDLTYNTPLFIRMNTVITYAISLMGTAVIYCIALKTQVSVADYYAFHTAYAYVSGAFTSLAAVGITLADIRPTLRLVAPLLEAEPEVTERQETVSALSGSIELSHVVFRYDSEGAAILDDVSLTIPAGQYVAVVGRSGCGKSTLMRLLLGFETPDKGSIYYNNKDSRKLDMASVRRQIGIVTQESRTFQGSIFENIAISCPMLTRSEAWEAAEIAGLAEDIRAMPMGMNTILQEGQGGLSGGQRQRLIIARAVASKPRILMFDEATSALDNLTQKKVSDALDAMHCTRVVIAHRLSTVRNCDRILVLEKGRIVEDGTYDALLTKNGFFADLVERQRID